MTSSGWTPNGNLRESKLPRYRGTPTKPLTVPADTPVLETAQIINVHSLRRRTEFHVREFLRS